MYIVPCAPILQKIVPDLSKSLPEVIELWRTEDYASFQFDYSRRGISRSSLSVAILNHFGSRAVKSHFITGLSISLTLLLLTTMISKTFTKKEVMKIGKKLLILLLPLQNKKENVWVAFLWHQLLRKLGKRKTFCLSADMIISTNMYVHLFVTVGFCGMLKLRKWRPDNLMIFLQSVGNIYKTRELLLTAFILLTSRAKHNERTESLETIKRKQRIQLCFLCC